MRSRCLVSLLVWLSVLAGVVSAQGLLLDERSDQTFRVPRVLLHPQPRPQPEQSYRIQELALQVQLKDQIAKARVSQTFVNTGSRQMEVCFIYPLPYDGAVDQMTFMVDGKEYPAKLMSAEEARRIYEGYVRRNQDPALVEWIGHGMLKTSVFPVPPGAERTVTLRYSQLCPSQNGLTELLLPLSTAKYTDQPVERIKIDVTIQGATSIKNVYSPTHAVRTERPQATTAVVHYEAEKQVPVSDFRLLYDVGQQPLGASLISFRPEKSEDGYFLLLVSPEIRQQAAQSRLAKNVIFVVDRSGSMSGKKIEQAKGALRFVLNNLNEGDLFNIVAYDSEVESFRPELQRFDEETRAAALGFVEGVYAGGSTNIDGALSAALGQLQDASRPNFVVFLTDGLPTAGERNEARIVKHASETNAVRARVFSFGVGFDVNSRMLDKLSRACFGQSIYVRPDEDIEAYVSRLYHRIGAPVMTDVQISYDMEGHSVEQGDLVNRVYPREVYDLFAGDQMVLVGRYRSGGAARVRIAGKVGQGEQDFDFPITFVEHSADESHAFVEKLWALRRVGQIIDEIDLQGQNQELVDELVQLATQHGIITPYTSFLADEMSLPGDVARLRREAVEELSKLEVVGGRVGFVQRDLKLSLQQAAQAAPAVALTFDAETSESKVQNVQHVGRKTFLYREGRWLDSSLTEKQVKQAKAVERYSPEYFELVRRAGKDKAQYMALEGKVVVLLDGRAYSY